MTNIRHTYRSLLLFLLFLSACRKYLDEKPDKRLQVPSTIQDCQALLSNSQLMINDNYSVPMLAETASDNYYLTNSDWNTMGLVDRNIYIWQPDLSVDYIRWFDGYQRVLTANQVLETLGNINPSTGEQSLYNQVKGIALFLRALNFYNTAQIWAQPFNPATAATDMGIPLRMTPDISEVTTRSSLQQTYQQITGDLEQAVALLPDIKPVSISTKAQPGKAAAYALQARIYLSMGDYEKAGASADACLKLYNALMDYNQLDTAANPPIIRFNTEVLFEASGTFSMPLFAGHIDSTLYQSYQPGDLRKKFFFADKGDGTWQFTGGYNGMPGYIVFNGLATDEMYLIRAECAARAGNTAAALADLNTLLQKRWEGAFVPFTAANAQEALDLVLRERRKELLFRGLRWIDLRRLNKDSHYAITLRRNLGGEIFSLPPGDLRYVFLIPREVLQRVNIPQNPR